MKIKNRDSEKLILPSNELDSVLTSSSQPSTMMQTVKKIEHEGVRDVLCECNSDSDGDGDGEDSQGSDDWVDSRHSLKMKALLYRSPPVPPSVSSNISSPEIDAMYVTTTLAMAMRESTAEVEVEVEVEAIVGRFEMTSQSAVQHSSDVVQTASTHPSTISTPIDIHQMPLQDSYSTLPIPCDQRSRVLAPNLIPTTQTSDPSRIYNGTDLQDGEIKGEKRPQLQMSKMSGSLLGTRSGSRSVAAPRTLRPAGVAVPLA